MVLCCSYWLSALVVRSLPVAAIIAVVKHVLQGFEDKMRVLFLQVNTQF